MLMGMADDPEWVKDMVNTYSRLTVELQEMLFAEEGYPDGIWYYEDMGYKQHPFMSPRMYREIIQPGHKYTMDWAHSHKLPVITARSRNDGSRDRLPAGYRGQGGDGSAASL
jgi:uroporphyrinogen decarboxylase